MLFFLTDGGCSNSQWKSCKFIIATSSVYTVKREGLVQLHLSWPSACGDWGTFIQVQPILWSN